MSFVFVILILILLFLLVVKLSADKYGPRSTEDEIHYVNTEDGWRIALHRYLPRGAKPHGEPVFMHHGFTANAQSFDLGTDPTTQATPSVAHYLADVGYDVWVCDLRGRGASDKPRLFGDKKWDWSMDQYIQKDDPAFVDYILAHSAYQNLHWIGHSMGGILLLCHLGLHGSPKIASGTAVGSGIDYTDTGSHYQSLIPYAGLVTKISRVPMGRVCKVFAPFCGRWGLGLEAFNYYPGNMAPGAARAVYAGIINDVSSRVVYQLSTLFTSGGIRSLETGEVYGDKLKNVTTPVMMVAGDRDLQSSVELAQKTMKLLPGKKHKALFVGKEFGHRSHYGHFDMLCGLNAKEEVLPEILGWLQTHRAKKSGRK